ncbi:MAG TPA: hypothetical protein DEA96_19265, partial [Leptospiraceae bacterium]|nr:hypothetical protein [Leptospiraceae bacterium]
KGNRRQSNLSVSESTFIPGNGYLDGIARQKTGKNAKSFQLQFLDLGGTKEGLPYLLKDFLIQFQFSYLYDIFVSVSLSRRYSCYHFSIASYQIGMCFNG